MSINTDLKMAYHMGYDDALAKRKPDASKVHMLRREMCDMVAQREADLEDAIMAENAKLRKLVKDIYMDMWALGEWLEPYEQRMRELGIEVE